MCELLIWTQPHGPFGSVSAPDRGGVTYVAPDGWRWGSKEIADPRFRVVKLPGVPVEACLHLVERIRALDGRELERYKFITNLDLIEQGRVLQPHDSVTYDATKLLSEVAVRVVPDPRVL